MDTSWIVLLVIAAGLIGLSVWLLRKVFKEDEDDAPETLDVDAMAAPFGGTDADDMADPDAGYRERRRIADEYLAQADAARAGRLGGRGGSIAQDVYVPSVAKPIRPRYQPAPTTRRQDEDDTAGMSASGLATLAALELGTPSAPEVSSPPEPVRSEPTQSHESAGSFTHAAPSADHSGGSTFASPDPGNSYSGSDPGNSFSSTDTGNSVSSSD